MIRIAVIHAAYVQPPNGLYDSNGHISKDKALGLIRSNIQKTCSLLREAGQRKADIAITNEDFADIGRYIRHVNELHLFKQFVLETEGPLLKELSSIAKEYGMYIAANEYETFERQVYNTTKLMDRNGECAGKYRKVHIPSGERFQVQSGKAPPEVFKTDIGNIGFATCYDIIFPEHFRVLALNGADMIIHQTQGWGTGGYSSVQTGEAFMRVRAAENSVYFIVAKNLFGEGGMSCVFDNYGNPVSSLLSPADHVFITDIEPDFDMIDSFDFDNFFSGTDSIRARHLLGRKPSAYGRLTEETPPVFSSKHLKEAKFFTEEEWAANIKSMDTMDEDKKRKLHW